ncbi:biotin--[acetyl-CoA-carboxylase] ligase [Salinibacter altiplanensis]|uniref:biotin--[acetyl-CoA-carboxylase] ligase n=1 Tax=Salinibacter altiplanensis TaxID=1803181 RepID=UPI000C9FD95B|nr:biotin--[acetyl-CoA-carboxylase] ligase [Salinibacter altiplanensis]
MALSLVKNAQDRLSTDHFGRPMRGVEEVGSTNERAAQWAAKGAPEGATVLTEYQTTGRGRHGREWTAEKGRNLLFSVVLRPGLSPDRFGLLTVAAGVAVAEAVETVVSPHSALLKWPNDVLLEDRKTCGILLESSLAPPDADAVVVLGVGLNVNQSDFPASLADTATSLRLAAGRPVPRPPLLAQLLQSLERRYEAVRTGDAASVRAAFRTRLASLGATRTLQAPGTDEALTGTVQGITETGALRLRTADGTVTEVHAGDVTSQN